MPLDRLAPPPPARVIRLSGDLYPPPAISRQEGLRVALPRFIPMRESLSLKAKLSPQPSPLLGRVGGYHLMPETQGLWGLKRTPRSVDALAFWKFIFETTLAPPNYDEIEQSFHLPYELYSYQVEGVNFLINHRFGLLADDMGLGKALSLDANILTPAGWKRMGEMRVGDEVVNTAGGVSKVIGVYPQGVIPLYRVTFSDGTSVECSADHLWAVSPGGGEPCRVLPLSEIMGEISAQNGEPKHYIPLTQPADFQGGDLPLDPYFLGLFLAAARFHGKNPIKEVLWRLGLRGCRSESEFIPQEYLFTSAENRIKLLRGLMDTGGIITDTRIQFCTPYPQLAQDVAFLVQSLGGVAGIQVGEAESQPSYTVRLDIPGKLNPFLYSRKEEEWASAPSRQPTRAIVSVEYAGEKPAQCIAVDAPDRCYITDHFIVTHNTVMALVSLKVLFYLGLIRKGLIISPPSVLSVWQQHLEEWAPEVTYQLVREDQRGRRKIWEQSEADLLLTSYPMIRIDGKEGILSKDAMENRFDLIILDEAHHIRNDTSQQSQVVKRLQAERKWAITGTPIQNRVEDIASLFEFLSPGYLTPLDVADHARLKQKLTSVMLRRRKDVELKGKLPPRNPTQEIWLELDEAQRAEYDEILGMGQEELAAAGENVSYTQIFVLLTKLKQVCNAASGAETSPKLELLSDQVSEIVENGNRVVVFSQYVQRGLNIIAPHMEKYGYAVIMGGQSDKERARQKERFQKGEAPVLLVSIKSGGEGLTLTEANYAIHFDFWWNPATKWQAEDRIYRIGQSKTVSVYEYWIKNTIEEMIYAKLEEKGLLFRDVIDTLSKPNATHLISKREWLRMFGVMR